MKKLLIIPAAGLATRMMPLSNSMSKAMIPVAGKPILAHILSAVRGKVDHIVVVHGAHNDIENFLKKKNYGDVSYCPQLTEFNGPLGAIYSGLASVDSDEDTQVLVWLGDTLIADEFDYDKFLSYDFKESTALGVGSVPDWSRWCMISEDGSIMFDKPSEEPPTDKALVGLYRWNYNYNKFKHIISELVKSGHEEIAPLIDSFSERALIDVSGSWIDCGDLPSLYKANSELIYSKARGHNNVTIKNSIVTKTSTNHEQEVNWYKTIRDKGVEVSALSPQFYGHGNKSYSIELCSGHTLQDLVLYHNINREDVWENVLSTVISRVQALYTNTRKFDNALHYPMLYHNFTRRYKQAESDGIINKGELEILSSFLEDSWNRFLAINMDTSLLIHGDLHFGNIFYDAATNKVKLIDPRGEWVTPLNCGGSIIYDIAKFYQSIVCNYCHVAADEELTPTEINQYKVLENIADKWWAKYYSNEVVELAKRYSICLIASAIPCHNDNKERQLRMKSIALEKIKGFVHEER